MEYENLSGGNFKPIPFLFISIQSLSIKMSNIFVAFIVA